MLRIRFQIYKSTKSVRHCTYERRNYRRRREPTKKVKVTMKLKSQALWKTKGDVIELSHIVAFTTAYNSIFFPFVMSFLRLDKKKKGKKKRERTRRNFVMEKVKKNRLQ